MDNGNITIHILVCSERSERFTKRRIVNCVRRRTDSKTNTNTVFIS